MAKIASTDAWHVFAWLAALTGLAVTAASAATPQAVCNNARVVAKVLPAIVNITNVRVSKNEDAAPDSSAPEQVEVFVGSGSVIDPSGVIITNKHVIRGVARAEAGGRGLHLSAITDADVTRYKLASKSGVLVDQVTAGSEAESLGLKPGEVIVQVGKDPATTPEDVEARLNHPHGADGDWISLLVQSGSDSQWIAWFAGRLQVSDLLVSTQPATVAPATDAAARKP
jgi:S1-C subfamily serine protease